MNAIVCTGTSGDTTTTEIVSIGEVAIDLASAAGIDVGDYVFISEADDSEIECLGKCIGKNSNTITCAAGPTAAKASGAKVWTPANILDFGVGVNGYAQPVDRGVLTEKTVGGVWTRNKIADTSEEITFIVPIMSATLYAAWGTFIDTTLLGYDTFTFVNERREIFQVQNTIRNEPGTRGPEGYRNIQFHFGINAAGVYD